MKCPCYSPEREKTLNAFMEGSYRTALDLQELKARVKLLEDQAMETNRILPSLREALRVFSEFNKTY